ncbi:hypothetical protein Micbo1qcDRAFT_165447 [Microdochium bolleyi]|uniref:Uncharacterized protein n=1 Tax=Microdochium bolleyi TaxID=196109 RepID=A0A136IWV4_9PEZI|nr:hypothetical protein Micbo1qcDRAFT_165447 [Microdochium bolleyi]
MSHLQSSAAASPSGPYSAAAPMYSRNEGAPPSFPPSLVGPRKSTLSSVTTASPLKESDKLSDEIMKSLSPAPDTSTSVHRLGPPTPTSGNAPERNREDRSLSGIYDDYYGFQEDKTLQETGRTLKTEAQTPLESATTTHPNTATQSTTQAAAPQHGLGMPEIRPLSPKKTGEVQPSTQNRERRFSFDAGPEHVTLSPVEAPTSTAVSFGSNSDRQQAKPEYKETSQLEANTHPALRATTTSPEPAPSPSQLQPATSTITHQVSQLTIGGDNDADAGTIDQPSPVSAEQSALSAANATMMPEDKVLVQPGLLAQESSTAPEVVSSPMAPAEKSEGIPEAVDAASAPAVNASAKIMPFREILSIGLPQHRIQKFDDTRSQFFHMETGLSEWLHHMQSQEGGINDGRGQGGNDLTSQTAAPAPQQPYYQQYLNASNPNLTMPPPSRQGTNVPAGQSPNMSHGQGQGQGQGQFGASGFNTGGQVGTKGKELLQAAGVLGNKGVKTGMKFFNKSKTKLREKVNQ